MISSVIAVHLKCVLHNLISTSKTGFLQDRFIGGSTRLIYFIMSYAESNNIDGLLMLIDFKKAFDSISWKFMYHTLYKFGFTKKFIKWIKLFNTNIKACILQFGFLSDFFSIERGCKQGDPLAPYQFLLCAQILFTNYTKQINQRNNYWKYKF